MIIKCDLCGTERDKNPADFARTKHNFCSKRCACIFNNRIPKRKRKKTCINCDNKILSSRKYCQNCKYHKIDYTLKEAIYTKHHKSSAFALIRSRARLVAKKEGWKSCEKCGYDKHIEIAHRKPIASFEESTKISTINHVSNLIPLCPNCHWEFDNNITR